MVAKLGYVLLGSVVGVLAFMVAVSVVLDSVLPHYIISHLEDAVAEACPKCELSIGALVLSPLLSTVSFKSVDFNSDPADSTAEKVKLGELNITYNVVELLGRRFEINSLTLSDLVVTVIEKYQPEPGGGKKKSASPVADYGGRFLEALPVIKFNRIDLQNAKLEYILKIFGRTAPFTVSDINARISTLGTRKFNSPRFTTADLTGRVQGSGALKFRCRADLYSVKNEDQIEIELRHQKMSDLDSFFTKEEGMQMEGELVKAQANINIDQGMLTGLLSADYHDLAIHVKATPETSDFKAFLTNLVSGLKIEKTKTAASTPPPSAPINYRREPGQGLIKFILGGLKDAAMQVVSK